jgi:hypothetical protein
LDALLETAQRHISSKDFRPARLLPTVWAKLQTTSRPRLGCVESFGGAVWQYSDLLERLVQIDPQTQKAFLEFSWAGGDPSQSAAQASSSGVAPTQSTPAQPSAAGGAGKEQAKEPQQKKEYTLEDVSKHSTKDDCWVVVNGEV